MKCPCCKGSGQINERTVDLYTRLLRAAERKYEYPKGELRIECNFGYSIVQLNVDGWRLTFNGREWRCTFNGRVVDAKPPEDLTTLLRVAHLHHVETKSIAPEPEDKK